MDDAKYLSVIFRIVLICFFSLISLVFVFVLFILNPLFNFGLSFVFNLYFIFVLFRLGR